MLKTQQESVKLAQGQIFNLELDKTNLTNDLICANEIIVKLKCEMKEMKNEE